LKLDGRVVLITGGAEGIGACCAREFSANGARISLLDLNPPSEPVLEDALFMQGDVTDQRTRELFVERSLSRFGTVDVLVNNAGVGLYQTVKGSSFSLSSQVFDLNVFAPLALTQLVLPVFGSKGSGVVVNFASIAAQVALPWAAMYCASKAAMGSLSESMRRELGRSGIRIITVAPGVVDTEFRNHVLAGLPPEPVAAIRGIKPERLARAIRQKIEGRGSWVIDPWYCRLFALADQFAPWLADAYIESRWHGRMGVPAQSETRTPTSRNA
jgi:NAD(P)-dependent dehydrogenase (short-subunit alcohol dehydrogenase family)